MSALNLNGKEIEMSEENVYCKDCTYLELKGESLNGALCKHPDCEESLEENRWYEHKETIFKGRPLLQNYYNNCELFEAKEEKNDKE